MIGLILVSAMCVSQNTNYLVAIKSYHSNEHIVSKLAPSLAVTKSIKGILKGNDTRGNFVISTSIPISEIKSLELVSNVSEVSPFRAGETVLLEIKNLKLSYPNDMRPDAEILKSLNLKLISEYPRDLFMVVAPINKTINFNLIAELEQSKYIIRIAPITQIEVIK